MISAKIDYLTISLLPDQSGWTISEALDRLFQALLIEEWRSWFVLVGAGYGYESIYRYNDVSLKVSSLSTFQKQGICLEFSGGGIAYYTEYLKAHKGVALRTALNRFRSMCQWSCKTKCSRIDWAIDEKCGADEKPYLDLDRIQQQLLDRHFVSLFRKTDPAVESGELQSCYKVSGEIDEKVPFTFIQSQHVSSGRVGKTIYLGKRKSGTYIRFYDKLSEQIAHGATVPEGVSAWTRFEMEFHQKNAAAVLTQYLDHTDDEFQAIMCGVALKLIRFVDPGRSRRYNCVTSKWWLEFLQNAKKANLTIHKIKRNKFLNFLLNFKKQYAACFSQAVKCSPEFLKSVLVDGLSKSSKTASQLVSDFNALQGLPQNFYDYEFDKSFKPETGEDYWRSFTDLDERAFHGRLSSIYREVFNKDVGAAAL